MFFLSVFSKMKHVKHDLGLAGHLKYIWHRNDSIADDTCFSYFFQGSGYCYVRPGSNRLVASTLRVLGTWYKSHSILSRSKN